MAMTDCKPDDDGNIECADCGHSYNINDLPSAPAPSGSGGCIRVYHCPKCEGVCCAERDKNKLKCEPDEDEYDTYHSRPSF